MVLIVITVTIICIVWICYKTKKGKDEADIGLKKIEAGLEIDRRHSCDKLLEALLKRMEMEKNTCPCNPENIKEFDNMLKSIFKIKTDIAKAVPETSRSDGTMTGDGYIVEDGQQLVKENEEQERGIA